VNDLKIEKKVRSIKLGFCVRCGKKLNRFNTSKWEVFVDPVLTAKICKKCEKKTSKGFTKCEGCIFQDDCSSNKDYNIIGCEEGKAIIKYLN
jgi:ribosomal protein L40E